MKKLIAGPWVGEFGWELFAWQGYIRSLAKHFDKTTIISRENSKSFYDDFTDEFYSYQPTGGLADAFFMHNLDIKTTFMSLVKEHKIILDKETTVILPRRFGIPPHTHYTNHLIFGDLMIQPDYIRFGVEGEKKYDYVFHIRDRDLRKEDNWSVENWSKLRDLLGNKKIACIGTKQESGIIDGTDDLRDIDIQELLNVMRNSTCAFGPSSGPMHLASLCGLPHVVWSIPQNKVRYEENWNPLKTKILFDSEHDWHPTPEYIYNKFKGWDV
tara:strand:+ start:88 stop:897 length:810 start_codon:yes stop_codon:yes gene_type:complete